MQGDKSTDFLIYTTPEGNVKVEAFLYNETIWLTQKRMAELFGVEANTINYHLKEIFSSKELDETPTIRNFRIVQKEGNRDIEREQIFYNLDAIIAVGYRVNSKQATHFRIWATHVLKEYIIKGFAMDDTRLKNGKYFGKDYFDELLERVRSIRASERRIYQKITDIFAECSIDYDPQSEITREFYATVQNKFHFAISGQTAAEIIYETADVKKKNMGLTTWKLAPKGRILRSDVVIAKNYLSEKEIKQLERTISSFFDYIERIIENKVEMKMNDLTKSVNKFLEFNEFRILEDKGKISFKQAEKKALKEYESFNKTQKIESDFDKFSKKLLIKK
ncbi:virulence RhuM family protein [Candidatus Woesearchaeota archaeon]|nr:virulence RhuM family protein [Candidatus Woesearchaeota archaeon]